MSRHRAFVVRAGACAALAAGAVGFAGCDFGAWVGSSIKATPTEIEYMPGTPATVNVGGSFVFGDQYACATHRGLAGVEPVLATPAGGGSTSVAVKEMWVTVSLPGECQPLPSPTNVKVEVNPGFGDLTAEVKVIAPRFDRYGVNIIDRYFLSQDVKLRPKPTPGPAPTPTTPTTPDPHHPPLAAEHAKAYRATARVRLTSGGFLSGGIQKGLSMTGILNNGAFRLTTPAKGAGVARPVELAAISAGTFAARSSAMPVGSPPSAAATVGTTTALLKGTGGALACVRIERTATATTWRFLGGTGKAARLSGTMSGPATPNALANAMSGPSAARAKATTRSPSRLRPGSAGYRITAKRGGAKRLPAACRTLRWALPRR